MAVELMMARTSWSMPWDVNPFLLLPRSGVRRVERGWEDEGDVARCGMFCPRRHRVDSNPRDCGAHRASSRLEIGVHRTYRGSLGRSRGHSWRLAPLRREAALGPRASREYGIRRGTERKGENGRRRREEERRWK